MASAADHAAEIVEKLEPWKVAFGELDTSVKRARRTIRYTIVSVILDILLTISVAFGLFHLNALEQQTATNASVTYHTCVTGNQARDAERHSWNLVFGALEASPTTTPAAAKAEKQYQDQIDHTLADRVCTNSANRKSEPWQPVSVT